MFHRIKQFFKNIFESKHFQPILDITLIWLASLCAILNAVDNKPVLTIIWSIVAFLDGITLYFHSQSR